MRNKKNIPNVTGIMPLQVNNSLCAEEVGSV